jgi:hypothetical protein
MWRSGASEAIGRFLPPSCKNLQRACRPQTVITLPRKSTRRSRTCSSERKPRRKSASSTPSSRTSTSRSTWRRLDVMALLASSPRAPSKNHGRKRPLPAQQQREQVSRSMPSSWRFSASLWRRRDGSSTPGGVEGWPEIATGPSSSTLGCRQTHPLPGLARNCMARAPVLACGLLPQGRGFWAETEPNPRRSIA